MHTPNVGPVLRKCRLAAGMTQQQLADVLMVDRVFISQVENGHRRISAEMYNDWIAVTKGPILAFTYVFGEIDGMSVKTI